MNARRSLAVGLAALLGAAGCGSKDDPVATPVLTITPSTQTVVAGGTAVPFTVTASSGTPTVSWVLFGEGTLSTTTGATTEYSPPATLASQATATLTASAPGYTTATATVTIQPVAPVLTILPSTRTVAAGGAAVPFTATASYGAPTITWTLTGVGTLSNAAGPATTYTPPATIDADATATLTASAPGYTSGTATITITPAGVPVITLTPSAQRVAAGGVPARFVAQANSGAPTITWTLDGVGTLSNATGPATTYLPPARVESITYATLTASAPGYVSGTATIMITVVILPALVITPSTPTVVAGGPAVGFTATDSGRGQPIDWTIWTLTGVGTLSTTEGPTTTYTPPPTVAARTTVALSASAVFIDSATAVITVEPPAPATVNGTEAGPAPSPESF